MRYLLLIIFIFAHNAFGGFPQGTHEKMFKDILEFKTSLKQIHDGSVDPQSVATPGDKGSLFLGDNGNVYVKQDAGTSTNWSMLSYYQLPSFTGNAGEFLRVASGEFTEEWARIPETSRLNLLTNPSFEFATEGNCVNCAIAQESFTTLTTVDNKQSLKITASADSAYYFFDVATSAQWHTGMQLVKFLWLKTSASGVQIVSRSAGTDSTTVIADVIGDNTWRSYKLYDVAGATNNGYKVKLPTSGDIVFIDEVEIRPTNSSDMPVLGQAHWVGNLYAKASNCAWSRTGAGWGSYPVDSDCTYTTEGEVLSPVTKKPAVRIGNARTDGYYRVHATVRLDSFTTSLACNWSLSSDGTYQDKPVVEAFNAINRFNQQITADFKFASSGDKEIEILSNGSIASSECQVTADGARDRSLSMSVHFYPDSNATVVSQDTELTKFTKNEFAARTGGFGSCSANRGNFDFLDATPCVRNSVGNFTLNYSDLNLTAAPVVWCTADRSGGVVSNCTVESVTATSATVRTYRQDNDALTDIVFNFGLTKDEADTNKTAKIIGKFENINDTPIIRIMAQNNSGGAYTGSSNMVFNSEIEDNFNLWNGSIFTSPRDTCYKVTGHGYFSGTITGDFRMKIDGGTGKKIGGIYSNSNGLFSGSFCLNEGQTFALGFSVSTSYNANSNFHHIEIVEEPSLSAIVKNLLAEASQTKCQTKYLSADVTTATTVTDVSFTGLVVGKKYHFTLTPAMQVNGDAQITTQAVHDGSNLFIYRCGSSSGQVLCGSSVESRPFVASATTIDVTTGSFSGTAPTLFGDGTANETHATLCQLPDTYTDYTGW